MLTWTALRLSLYLLMFLDEESLSRPIQEKRYRRNDWYKNSTFRKNGRVRRSIPDVDAVNPAYFDVDAQPDQEQPIDPRGDISSFSLTDQVGNLFRSNRLGKHVQKTHGRPPQSERAVNLGAEEQSLVNGRLPADEQEECYKQQNIELPSQDEPSRGKWEKDQEPQAMPIMYIGQEPHMMSDNTVGNEMLEKRDKGFGGRGVEKQEVDSLYSDPEQVLKPKKVKSYSQSRSPESISEYSRVYKPLGVQPEFPIYDEDLDFHPDPLQGILDDKYWLDPQEQEAAVRKYIDLASSNMMPTEMDYEKRNAEKGDHKVKSVNSKIGFKDADSQCPCKEISACGDCSKGKKKTNYSESDGESMLYGRKLLSTGYKTDNMDKLSVKKTHSSNSDEVSNLSRDYISDFSDGENRVIVDGRNAPIYENMDGCSSFKDRKPLSLEENPNILSNEEDIESNDILPNKHYFLGRRILWYNAYDEDEDSYSDEDNEEVEHSHSVLTKVSGDGHFTNRVANRHEDTHLTSLLENGRLVSILDEHIGEDGRKNSELSNLPSRHQFNQSINEMKMSSFNNPNKPPGYYTSNKLLNIIQKPFQEKPKGPKKNKTDFSYEFEVMRNKTLYNATFEATSEKPTRPKVCYKRNNRNYLSAPKNRRSYSEVPMFGKNQQDASLLQSAEGFLGSNVKDGTTVSNSSTQSGLSTSQPQAINCTIASPNVTVASPNKTSQLAANNTKQDAEETVDAEVANDIVETVISESEKSSVLGHNLGICKRNESVTKMRYGQIVPEAEKVLKTVTDCIMDRIRAHLAKQSCILLDDELSEFLKWMVLSGESYKEYMQRLGPKYYDFVPVTTVNVTTCGPPTSQICEQEPLPPNPNIVSSLESNSEQVSVDLSN